MILSQRKLVLEGDLAALSSAVFEVLLVNLKGKGGNCRAKEMVERTESLFTFNANMVTVCLEGLRIYAGQALS